MADLLSSHRTADVSSASSRAGAAAVGKHTLVEQLGSQPVSGGYRSAHAAAAQPGTQGPAAGGADAPSPRGRLDQLFGRLDQLFGRPDIGRDPGDDRTAPGGGLPPVLRSQLEGQFGADFSAIRVHPGSDQPASVGADALATGDDLHFAAGAYEPHTSSGMQLIGHELAHVIQQRQGRISPNAASARAAKDASPSPPGAIARNLHVDPALEHEADAIGDRIASGAAVATGDGSARSTAVQPGKRRGKTKSLVAPGPGTPKSPGVNHTTDADARRRARNQQKKLRAKQRKQAAAGAALAQPQATPPAPDHDAPPAHDHDAPPAHQDPGDDRSDEADMDEEDKLGVEHDKQSDETSEEFLDRVVGAQAATAVSQKPAEHAARFEQRLRDAANNTPRRELAEDSLVLDTNIFSGLIQLMTGARWDGLQANKQFGVNYLRTHARAPLPPILEPAFAFKVDAKLDEIIGAGYDLRAANMTLAELPDNTIPMQGLKVIVPRDSEVYQIAIGLLTDTGIGQAKGAADRSIIADMLFSEGHKPRFMTSDIDVFSRLYQHFGPNVDSDKAGSVGQDGKRISWTMLILARYPSGFDIRIGFRAMTIIVIPGR